MEYRREIDGLRAVAVIPVILFHAKIAAFSGGFVGVDVFFVISGYLISSILLAEAEADRFSLLRFYERRVRRILPALFAVLFASLIMSWIWMLPSEFRTFSQSLVATLAFCSNVFFLIKVDYFTGPAESNPLLHTWSLAVEEQFYLLFPLFIAAMWKARKQLLLSSLVGISVVSFVIAQWASINMPQAAFYLLPTRAWELGAGAIAAYWLRFGGAKVGGLAAAPWLREVLGVIGLAAILWATFAYTELTPFPGVYALAPVIGATLIVLYADSTSLVGRLLGSRILVGIGLISYSAYLWHQPLFVFARLRSEVPPRPVVFLLLTALTLVIAYASWRWVELPFRRKPQNGGVSRRVVFAGSGAVAMAFLVTGLLGHFTQGFPSRSSLNARLVSNTGLGIQCNGNTAWIGSCMSTGSPSIAVWGDSFAMHLVPGLLQSIPGAGIVQLAQDSCPPILGYQVAQRGINRTCDVFNRMVLASIREHATSLKLVVLSSTFGALNADPVARDGNANPLELLQGTIDTIRSLGLAVVVVAPPPRTSKDFGRCYFLTERRGEKLERCNFLTSDITPQHLRVESELRKLHNARIIWLSSLICSEGRCTAYRDGTIIYRDEGHLSVEGSRLIGSLGHFSELLN